MINFLHREGSGLFAIYSDLSTSNKNFHENFNFKSYLSGLKFHRRHEMCGAPEAYRNPSTDGHKSLHKLTFLTSHSHNELLNFNLKHSNECFLKFYKSHKFYAYVSL